MYRFSSSKDIPDSQQNRRASFPKNSEKNEYFRIRRNRFADNGARTKDSQAASDVLARMTQLKDSVVFGNI